LNQELHIVCPAVPWPLNNKRAIDIFNQLKIFHHNGAGVHLHYFCEEKNCHPNELNKFCVSVHRYHDNEKEKLISLLQNDNLPILFEGSDHALDLAALSGNDRKIVHRMYDNCTCSKRPAPAPSFLSKINFLKKGMNEEGNFKKQCQYLFAYHNDLEKAQKNDNCCEAIVLPLLNPYRKINSPAGLGNYCLYHGDLGDAANEKAVLWLLENVFDDIQVPVVVAGRQPGKKIERLAELYAHCCLVADPSENEMNDLVRKAQLHVLPSFGCRQPELKLLHSLHEGRHCLVNEAAIADTGLEACCHIATNAHGFKSIILQLLHRPFEEEEIRIRERTFQALREKDPAIVLLSVVS
jgi:hypothetical protein